MSRSVHRYWHSKHGRNPLWIQNEIVVKLPLQWFISSRRDGCCIKQTYLVQLALEVVRMLIDHVFLNKWTGLEQFLALSTSPPALIFLFNPVGNHNGHFTMNHTSSVSHRGGERIITHSSYRVPPKSVGSTVSRSIKHAIFPSKISAHRSSLGPSCFRPFSLSLSPPSAAGVGISWPSARLSCFAHLRISSSGWSVTTSQ